MLHDCCQADWCLCDSSLSLTSQVVRFVKQSDAAVALSGGSATSPALDASAQGGPPQISAESSEYQNIVESLQNMSAKADSVLDQVKIHPLADNSAGIQETVQNVAKFSKAMADNSDKLGETIAQLDRLTATLDNNRGNIDSIMTNGSELAAKLNKSASKIDGVLKREKSHKPAGLEGHVQQRGRCRESIHKLADNLDRFTGTGLQKYETLATDGQKTLNEVNNAVRSLEKNPQQVIFGAKPTLPEYSGSR